MNRIDCESRELAVNTLQHFYNVTSLQIEHFFYEINVETYYLQLEDHEHDEDFEPNPAGFIKDRFEEYFGSPRFDIDEVCWFHVTRTLPNNKFTEGLLPLNESLELIWKTFF